MLFVQDGTFSCERKQCPAVTCLNPAPGECCPECNNCQLDGRLYQNGQRFSDPTDQCQQCACEVSIMVGVGQQRDNCLLLFYLYCLIGISVMCWWLGYHGKFRTLSLGKPVATVTVPNLRCMLCFFGVFCCCFLCFHNLPKSDKGYRIFNVHMWSFFMCVHQFGGGERGALCLWFHPKEFCWV